MADIKKEADTVRGPFVAIASAQEAIGGATLFALDRDGRIWRRSTGFSGAWEEVYQPPHNTYWPRNVWDEVPEGAPAASDGTVVEGRESAAGDELLRRSVQAVTAQRVLDLVEEFELRDPSDTTVRKWVLEQFGEKIGEKIGDEATKTFTKKVSDMVATEGGDRECPLPLSVIPNYMGINLCSVDSLSWVKQDDEQLVSLTIHFIPAPPGEGRPPRPRHGPPRRKKPGREDA